MGGGEMDVDEGPFVFGRNQASSSSVASSPFNRIFAEDENDEDPLESEEMEVEDAVENPVFGDPVEDQNFNLLVGDYPLRYIGDDNKGLNLSKIFQTPNGTRYWCPDVSEEFKPVVGKVYSSYAEVRRMYETYGDKAGFGIRSSASKTNKHKVVTHRLLTCNRAGNPKGKTLDIVHPMSYGRIRGISYKVTDCKACIRLKIVKGTEKYKIYKFEENHNHEFVHSDNMDLTRMSRHLNFDDIQFVHTMSVQKVGPVAAHRIQSALRGGHHNMRGTRNAYKTVSRELRMFVGNRDVKLFLIRMKERAKTLPNFAYEILHDGTELNGIFWADEVARLSYEKFGDVMGFDATYSTNK